MTDSTKPSRSTFLFRMLGSAVIASLLIFVAVGLGIRFYRQPEPSAELADLQQVNVVSLLDHPEIAAAIRKAKENSSRPNPPEPPPTVIPEREVTGFVQLEYTVNPDGTASNIHVVGAAPAGVYEEQAIAKVRAGTFQPAHDADGKPVARQASDVVNFSVPASELPAKRD